MANREANRGAHYLVQILVPQYDNEGEPFGPDVFSRVRQELVERFGGLTAHVRAPARGLWQAEDGTVARDDVVILEVMADGLERSWWADYRRTLEARFRQDEVVIRATPIERL